MPNDKSLLTGSTTMLILKLLDGRDMYGYQMIDELSKKSDNTFTLKAGTLYPLLHGLESQEVVTAYEDVAEGIKTRKYYHLTSKGKKLLSEKQQEWEAYTKAVNQVLQKGVLHATI